MEPALPTPGEEPLTDGTTPVKAADLRTWDYATARAQALAHAGTVRIRAGLDTRKDQPHDDAHWAAQLHADRTRLQRLLASGAWTWGQGRLVVIR